MTTSQHLHHNPNCDVLVVDDSPGYNSSCNTTVIADTSMMGRTDESSISYDEKDVTVQQIGYFDLYKHPDVVVADHGEVDNKSSKNSSVKHMHLTQVTETGEKCDYELH